MIRKFNSLIAAFLIVGLALYVVILNRESLTIALSPQALVTAPTGVILIAVFGLGILAASLVSFFFGFKAYLRERGLLSRERQREAFFNLQVKARSLGAAGESAKAREIWLQVLRKDPDNIIARVECSRLLEAEGDRQEALRILDAARAVAPDNAEVLFRAAELNIGLGNKTAAIDNLALILYHQPIARAAEKARDLSEELGRVDDAIEYHAQLEKLTHLGGENDEVLARLRFKKILKETGSDHEALEGQLRTHLKRFPNSEDAIVALADLEAARGEVEAAAQYLVKGARASGKPPLWQKAVELWLRADKPDRALAAARSATKETTGENRIYTEVGLIKTYIELNMFEEARSLLENLPALSKQENVSLPEPLEEQVHLLKALCLGEIGQARESAGVIRTLLLSEEKRSALGLPSGSPTTLTISQSAPEPRLSTP